MGTIWFILKFDLGVGCLVGAGWILLNEGFPSVLFIILLVPLGLLILRSVAADVSG